MHKKSGASGKAKTAVTAHKRSRASGKTKTAIKCKTAFVGRERHGGGGAIPGYTLHGDIYVPNNLKPVSAVKLSKGLEKAKGDIKKLLKSLAGTLTKEYSIKQIQFTVSFDAQGKFLGIGVGGSTSVTVIAEPKNNSPVISDR